ncbi:hypothetical protein NXY15_08845 [Bacteroides thetaiotaomicron]|nr:hypothetical protein NXY15_08845 [Bacteroides thetaiotaomicron]
MTQCDVLDVDPTGWYSENVAYSSLENVDLYVKGLYSVLYDNATINIDSYCLMDDGATDLLKYSWYGVNGGARINSFIRRIMSPKRATSAPTGVVCIPVSVNSTNISMTEAKVMEIT